MCLTGNKTFDSILVIGATVAATVVAGPQAGMATYAAIGAGSGAAMAGAQGRDPLTGAVIGGILGGVTGGMAPPGTDQAAQIAAQEAAAQTVTGQVGAAITNLSAQQFTSIGAQQVGQMAIGTTAGAAFGLMMPGTPDYSGYTPASQQVVQQQFNSQQIATTGSGGRQATASLAEAIKRSKQRKLSQADVGDLSIDTSSFASTGLQFA
jgi:hypothetical protein